MSGCMEYSVVEFDESHGRTGRKVILLSGIVLTWTIGKEATDAYLAVGKPH